MVCEKFPLVSKNGTIRTALMTEAVFPHAFPDSFEAKVYAYILNSLQINPVTSCECERTLSVLERLLCDLRSARVM